MTFTEKVPLRPSPVGSPSSPSLPARQHEVHQYQSGIYHIAYEARPHSTFPFTVPIRAIRQAHEAAPFLWRLICEIFDTNPLLFVVYIMCTLWDSIAPAVGLWSSGALLSIIEESINRGRLMQDELHVLILVSLFSTLVSTLGNHIVEGVKEKIRGHLRARFLPQLVQARFRLDVLPQRKEPAFDLMPSAWNFDDEAPGWDCIHDLFYNLQKMLTVILQIVVMTCLISHRRCPEAEILASLCMAQPLIYWITPINGLGGAAYVFWTENPHMKRLQALFHMAFSKEYRRDLVTDNTSKFVEEEYRKTSDILGVVHKSEFSLATYIPRPWYWNFLSGLFINLPLTMYAITLPWTFSVSSLSSIALLQQATQTIRLNVMHYHFDQASFLRIFSLAKRLYEAVEVQNSSFMGTMDYPDSTSSSEKGMKISYRHVSLNYRGQGKSALHDVSFDILPGQTVVIVGENGSGKSSMLKLLARLYDPTAGDITIDDNPITSFNVSRLRESMSFLAQNQEIYPLSIRENIEMGLNAGGSLGQDKVHEAARLGGSYEWIMGLPDGFDTVLKPLNTAGRNVLGLGYDRLPEALSHILDQHLKANISISGGEQQRLAASRTFFRLCNSDIKLLVVDEPTSALDPIAENSLLQSFRSMHEGKTMIFVTHRFGNLVKHADMILCMDKGKIVETGTHEQLTKEGGIYAKLYNVQAAGFE